MKESTIYNKAREMIGLMFVVGVNNFSFCIDTPKGSFQVTVEKKQNEGVGEE